MTETISEESPENRQERKSIYGRRAELIYSLKLLVSNRLVLLGLVVVVVSTGLALFSGYLVNPGQWHITNGSARLCWSNPLINWNTPNPSPCPAGSSHPLGTDNYGRDLWQMIILGLPIDLELAFEIVVAALIIGVVLGSVAAYVGGKVDEAILRVTDVFFAFPALVLALVILAVTPPPRSLNDLALAVLIVWWPLYVRLTRSQILAEKEKMYVEALRAVGAGRIRILFRHIIPNSIYPVFVQATLDIGGVILTFSALMYLGFTPDAYLPELGQLTTDGINNVVSAPWLVIFPGLVILIVALGWNLLGDGVRDVLDPRLRR